MDGNPPIKLRYLLAPADPSRPSLLSASSTLAKSNGLAKGPTSCAEPGTMSDRVVAVYFSRLVLAHPRKSYPVRRCAGDCPDQRGEVCGYLRQRQGVFG